MKILVIEDDKEISEMLGNFLASENFSVVCAYDGKEALDIFKESSPDIILLDLMIPEINGMAVMQQIRKQSTVPIIIMSAKDTDSDITLGLGLGADDYITKPFSVTQVLARIKSNLRRTQQYDALPMQNGEAESSRITWGELTMDLDDYNVSKNGSQVELTIKEYEILKLLMLHPKKVYTKEQIYSLIWNDAYMGDENAVNVHISRLRSKIEENPRNPEYIITVWGIGYKIGEMK